LAIARSIIKRPRILILDEATSAIDIHSEKIVQAALDRVSKNRTTIMIAHRLSTVRKADNIVVLKKGRVMQQGTHEELLGDTSGIYWGLAHAQQLSFGDDSNEATSSSDLEKQNVHMKVSEGFSEEPEPVWSSGRQLRKAKSYRASFALFLWEQKFQWKWYSLMLFGALGAGGKCLRSIDFGVPD
jgi:ABC-type multidrug transport system ATPase subunit